MQVAKSQKILGKSAITLWKVHSKTDEEKGNMIFL